MRHSTYIPVLIILCVIFSCGKKVEKGGQAQVLITGGSVYDGTGEQPQNWNVLITGDRIEYIGPEVPQVDDSATVIDASGMVVAPGFIDPHTHAIQDMDDPSTSHNLPFMTQGVTTLIAGSDGRSEVPITPAFEKWEKNGIGTNVVLLVGHGQVRTNAMGMDNRKPTDAELEEMKAMVKQAMEDGAFGISTGLYYTPGFYADTEEVIELSKIVAEYQGIYDTHQRDESSYSIGLLASIEEVIRIGREAKLPVHISHIKALGTDVWDKSEEAIAIIEAAQAEGIEVTANQYPYVASGTNMAASTLARWVQAGGEEKMLERLNDPELAERIRGEMKDNIRRRGGASSLLLIRPIMRSWQSKTLADLAAEWGVSDVDAALRVIKEGGSGLASFNMKESDLVNFMKQEWVMTGSDGSSGHPRKYGTFPRKIKKYVMTDSVLTLGAMINRSSARTAEIFRIPERGKLVEGFYGDVVIFDPNTITDQAWFTNPEEFSVGIEYVIVNGKVTIDRGNWLGEKFGRVLRKTDP